MRSVPIAASLLLLVVLVPAGSAQASPETLRRSFGNMVGCLTDIATSPIVAGQTLVTNLRDIGDSRGVRIAYTIPGYFWLVSLQIGAGTLRGITGVIEFIPGVALFPFKADLDPLFDPVDRASALIEWENPLAETRGWRWVPVITMDMKYGVNYQAPAY